MSKKSADVKIIVIGNAGVGKTCFIYKWNKRVFPEGSKTTIACNLDYKIKRVEGVMYRIQVWDLPGTDKDKSMTRSLSKNCHGVIIVFSGDVENSFEEVLSWRQSVVDINPESQIPFILVKSKVDLENKGEDEVEKEKEEIEKEIDHFNDKFKAYYRVSSKENLNVDEVFDFAISEAIEFVNKENGIQSCRGDNFQLNQEPQKREKKKCC